MKVSAFLKVMCIITTMGVLYINLQMSIYDRAYQGKSKEDRIVKLAVYFVFLLFRLFDKKTNQT